MDKERTGPLTDDGTGVTVGLLHTGASYADDLADDGVIYHYPKTNRPAGRDAAEVRLEPPNDVCAPQGHFPAW